VMVVTVVALVVLVQIVQMGGDWLARHADKKDV
jgi:D-methionine transport system permease protein